MPARAATTSTPERATAASMVPDQVEVGHANATPVPIATRSETVPTIP